MTDEVNLDLNGITDTQKFLNQVELLMSQSDELNFMDAVLHVCEQNGLEVETAASIIKNNPKMKSQLQLVGEQLNYLPKSARLDL
jgi:hypothetical protein